MEPVKLTTLIKEAAKKTRQQKSGQPLVNYQPPGLPIIINPIMSALNNVPDGFKPIDVGR